MAGHDTALVVEFLNPETCKIVGPGAEARPIAADIEPLDPGGGDQRRIAIHHHVLRQLQLTASIGDVADCLPAFLDVRGRLAVDPKIALSLRQELPHADRCLRLAAGLRQRSFKAAVATVTATKYAMPIRLT